MLWTMKLLNLFRLPLFWLAYCTFFTMITGRGYTTLSTALLSLAIVINNFGFICYATAMLPFITDQIIGNSQKIGLVAVGKAGISRKQPIGNWSMSKHVRYHQ